MKKIGIVFFIIIGAFVYWTSNSTSGKSKPRNDKAVLTAINSQGPSSNCIFVCPSGLSIFKKIVLVDPRGTKYEVTHRDLWATKLQFPAGSYAIFLSETSKYEMPKGTPQYFAFRPNSVYTLNDASTSPTLVGYSRGSQAKALPSPFYSQKLSSN